MLQYSEFSMHKKASSLLWDGLLKEGKVDSQEQPNQSVFLAWISRNSPNQAPAGIFDWIK